MNPPDSGCPFPRDHVLPRSLLRTNTIESIPRGSPRKMKGCLEKLGPQTALAVFRQSPSSRKTRASWKAMIPFSITYGFQSFQSCSTASSRWSPSINRKSIGLFQAATASWLKASIHTVLPRDFAETARLAARRRKFSPALSKDETGPRDTVCLPDPWWSAGQTADAPSATPISTRLLRLRACFSSAWCSAAVCCAIGGRNLAHAKNGCFITRPIHLSGFLSSG